MKYIILFIAGLCVSMVSFGQTVYPVTASSPAGVHQIVTNRRLANDFFQTMRVLSEPSTLSVLGTDYTHNFNDSLQKKMYILNADVQAPFALGGKRWIIWKTMLWSIHVTPQFKVKILNNDKAQGDSSLPVRTPSYMPGITLFTTPKCLWPDTGSLRTWHHYFFARGFHHSNGQDGDEFVNDSKGSPMIKDSINYYNGNFGEDWVWEFGYGAFWTSGYSIPEDTSEVKGSDFRGRKRVISRTFTIYGRAGYEWHPKKLSNADFQKFHMYGRHRVNLNLSGIYSPSVRDIILGEDGSYYSDETFRDKETWRLTMNSTYIVDRNYNRGDLRYLYDVPALSMERFNVSATIYKTLPRNSNAAVFVQFNHFGSDPYNIYFNQRMVEGRFGLAFGFFKD